MISAQGLLSVALLVSYVEGSSIQRASIQFANSNRGQNIQTQNNRALITHGRGLASHRNVSSNDDKSSSISPENRSGIQRTSDLNIVKGRPVGGGAKTPSFEEFIIRQPLKSKERPPKLSDNFIRNVLEVAATKVNDVDFLHAIQSIEDHLERTVGGSRKTTSIPTTITSTSPVDTLLASAAVVPQNIIRKFVINSKNEISEVRGNIKNVLTSLNSKIFDSNNNRSPVNSFSRSNNEVRKKIVLVPRNMTMDVLKMHLPQFSSQNLRVAKLVSTPKTGNKATGNMHLPQFSSQNLRVANLVSTSKKGHKATGNIFVLPGGTIVSNNRLTKKPFPQTSEQSKEPLINQPTVNEQTNQQNKLLSHQLNNVVKQTNRNIVQTDIIKGRLSSKIPNVSSPKNSFTGGTDIDRAQSDFNEQLDNPFSFQSENFPSSTFSSPKDSLFAAFSKSTRARENLNPPLTHSTIQVKEKQNIENPFTQSEIQKDYFAPSLYLGPIEIAQFIKSVQPTFGGDLDIVKASRVNKEQRKTDSVKSSNNRISDGTIFEKPNFFESASQAIFQDPFVFTQESFRRPKSQPLKHERLSNIENSRFRDDLQLSHIQPNLELFPEASRFRSIPHLRKKHSPSNGIVSARSAVDTLDLSWFGTSHPGIDLATIDPHKRIAN